MENPKQKRLLVIFIIILAILNIAVLSTFWMSSRHHLPKHGHHRQKTHSEGLKVLTKKLNLSEAQQNTFKELRTAHFDKLNALEMIVKNKKDAFFQEMTSQNAQDSVVFSRIEEANAALDDIDKNLYKHYKQLMENCNEEQKEILRKMFAGMIKSQHRKR